MIKHMHKGLFIVCLVFISWACQAKTCKGLEACDLRFTQTSLFGAMCSGTLQTRIFTIRNSTPVTMPLNISVVNSNGTPNPSATIGTAPSNNCGSSLAAGASCNIEVDVQPSSPENFNLLLQVSGGSTQSKITTPITLSALGGCNVGFNLPLATFTDICPALSESQTYTITNNTLTPLPIGTISIATLPGDSYGGTVAIGAPGTPCLTGNFLGAGASCNIEVDVNTPPGASTGLVNRLLQVNINNVTLAAPINLTVLSSCTFIFTNPLPAPFSMACDVTQELTYIVKNNTGVAGAVTLPTLLVDGADTLPLAATINVGASTCGPAIPTGGTCTVVVDLFEACAGGTTGIVNRTLEVTTPNPALLDAPPILITITVPPPPPPPPTNYLGAAAACAVLGSSTVTNTGSSVITNGDVCLSPGTSVTGFPPGTVAGGTIEINTAIANNAQAALGTAITNLTGPSFPCTTNLTGTDLGTLPPLTAGVRCFNTSAQLTGTLTLTGSSTDVFVFQIGSTLTSATGSQVVLVGVNPANVYWVVGTSATIGVSSQFQGNILAVASITMDTSASLLNGRALANTGAVTLDTNAVTAP